MLQDLLKGWRKKRLSFDVFKKGLLRLKRLFAGQFRGDLIKLDSQTLNAYYDAVCNLPDELYMAAILKVEESYNKITGFPQPADIHKAAQDVLKEIAEKQWYKLKEAISFKGAWVSKFIADELTMFILDRFFGGWVGFCNMLVDEEDFKKKLFVEKFVHYALRPEEVETLTHLEGIATDGSVLELEKIPEIRKKLKEAAIKRLKRQESLKQLEPAQIDHSQIDHYIYPLLRR